MAEELNLQYEQYIGDSVYLWLQEAKEGARIVRGLPGWCYCLDGPRETSGYRGH